MTCFSFVITTGTNFVVLVQLNSPAFVSPFCALAAEDTPPRIALSPTSALQVPQAIQTMLRQANYKLVSLTPLGQGMNTFGQAIGFFFVAQVKNKIRNRLCD
jgi:hypothetical protein